MTARGLMLSAGLRRQIAAHARESRPREAVGLLGGTETGEVTVVLPLENIAAGNRAFIADPYAQFCALRRLQSEQLQLLAIYHSHPGGGVDPSPEDLSYARRWSCMHVIVAPGLNAEADARLRAFRCDRQGAIAEVEIRSPGAGATAEVATA